jgi:hypothetical protein
MNSLEIEAEIAVRQYKRWLETQQDASVKSVWEDDNQSIMDITL